MLLSRILPQPRKLIPRNSIESYDSLVDPRKLSPSKITRYTVLFVDEPGTDSGVLLVDGPGTDSGILRVVGPGMDSGVDGVRIDDDVLLVDGPGINNNVLLVDGPGIDDDVLLVDEPGTDSGVDGVGIDNDVLLVDGPTTDYSRDCNICHRFINSIQYVKLRS